MGYSDHDLGVAFALTAAAGLSTTIGAAVVFVPSFHTPQFLGMSLAFASGVMLYVSYIEIFFKSLEEFELHYDEQNNVSRSDVSAEDYEADPDAYYCATVTFFAGMMLTYIVDRLITHMKGEGHSDGTINFNAPQAHGLHGLHRHEESLSQTFSPSSRKTEVQGEDNSPDARTESYTTSMGARNAGPDNAADVPAETEGETGASDTAAEDKRKSLIKTALIASAAIITHNFPEGLATFIATAQDSSVGASLAIAIGVHNIPEGIVVAIPILHATGSKWKAFFWGTVSGLAETAAGAVGWIMLSQSDSDISHLGYALLFGFVAGMMVYICIKELIPTAHKYDPDDSRVTNTLILGMIVMAVSLCLFVA